MHAKQSEIENFLDKDLLPQVKSRLSDLDRGKQASIEVEIEEAVQKAKEVGIDPETTPRVMELREKFGSEFNSAQMEDEIYSHLYSFFARYYQNGDFMSMRRYKEGVYAIPYEGQEVYLHWANKDQYYIKSSENLKNYTFKLDDSHRVTFRIMEADTETDNKKSVDGKDRRFVFVPDSAEISDDNKLLVMGFEHRSVDNKKTQKVLIEECIKHVQENIADYGDFLAGLLSLRATEKNKNRTLLEKHLGDYTAKNSFDYFIHKDLGGFLRRELDFYIKNEVMHLDDIENESAPRVEQYLTKVKVIRGIAKKIISFLAQLEDFQKKLWLKKKFVVETNYCITLDRVPQALYGEIAANADQWDEWDKLGFLTKEEMGSAEKDDKGELALGDQNLPDIKTAEYLEAFPYLVLDTRFFDGVFKQKLLASIDNIDEQCDGLLINSENFQALNMLQERYREQVKCVYIDPPYNTGSDTDFFYKDAYRYSSWIAMIHDRVSRSLTLIKETGSLFSQIDDYEEHHLRLVLDSIFSEDLRINRIAWLRTFNSGSSKGLSKKLPANLDTIYWYAKSKKYEHKKELRPYSKGALKRYDKHDEKGRFKWNPMKTYSKEKLERLISSGDAMWTESSKYPVYKKYLDENSGAPLDNNWNDIAGIGTFASERTGFLTQKPAKLIERCIKLTNGDLVLDYFAGSGTTGHAVINLNRGDNGKRKYILVEMGDHFDTVLKLRIQKVIFSKDWKNGKPGDASSGVSHCFKCIRLESYEDCLNNLQLARSSAQDELLIQHDDLRQDYMLNYMLDIETRGSLLNIDAFEEPFSYKMNIATGTVGETKPINIDLVETFNYLIGLKIKTIDTIRGVHVVTGENLAGERILVLWRNTKDMKSPKLDEWFKKQGYNTQDMEFDLIYVNGDNNLENLKKDEQTWKVRLVEAEFQRLMFEESE